MPGYQTSDASPLAHYKERGEAKLLESGSCEKDKVLFCASALSREQTGFNLAQNRVIYF